MENDKLCPVCGEGRLTDQSRLVAAIYKTKEGRVEDHFSICDACGTEQAGADHLRRNKRSMMAFRKEVDGLLTGEQIRGLRQRWRISQKQAAKLFGGGPIAFSKYENNDVAQSEPMDLLLRVANAVPEAFQWLKQNAGLADESLTFVPSAWGSSRTRIYKYYERVSAENISVRVDAIPVAANDDELAGMFQLA